MIGNHNAKVRVERFMLTSIKFPPCYTTKDDQVKKLEYSYDQQIYI